MRAFPASAKEDAGRGRIEAVGAGRPLIPKQIVEDDLRALPAKAPNRVPQPPGVLLRSDALGAVRRIALPPDLRRPDRPSPARQDRVLGFGCARDRRIEGWHRRRLDIRPGITGPWQVLGSARIPVREMVKLDYQYV